MEPPGTAQVQQSRPEAKFSRFLTVVSQEKNKLFNNFTAPENLFEFFLTRSLI